MIPRPLLPRLSQRLLPALLIFVLYFLLSGPAKGQNPNVARFAEIAKQVTNHEFSDKFDPKISEALDILIAETLKVYRNKPNATPSQIEAALKPFEKVANPSKEETPLPTSMTWFQVSAQQQGDHVAIGVNYGPYARLRVQNLHTQQRERLPAELDWMFRWRLNPTFTPSGTLLLLSESIQDAGIRVQMRMDYLPPDKTGFTLQKSFTRTCTLDGGGMELKGNRLIVRSIDPPKAFFTSNAETLFPRKEEIDCSGQSPRWLSDEKQQAAFRALDAWMFQAQHTKSPDNQQAIIKSLLPEQSMIEDYTIKKLDSDTTQFDLVFDGKTLRCLVKGNSGSYRVVSSKVLQGKKRNEE